MSRESLMSWVYGVINELESFELHRKNLKSTVWSQLYKIIKNHDIFKEWIYSRPRTDVSGFVISLRDYNSHPYYSSATALGYCRSVWQKIEHDLRDENPTRFMKELFQKVFILLHSKCCINNILRDLKGLPPTTPHDTFVELTSYTMQDIVSNPYLPNLRPSSTPVNIQIGGHSFNAAHPGSSPNDLATANKQDRSRQATCRQHSSTNTVLDQTLLPKVKFERNTDGNAASSHTRKISEASKKSVEYQADSSLTHNATQTTEKIAGASEGRHIKQEVNDEHSYGQKVEGRPSGWKQFIQQIIGVGNNQSVQSAEPSKSGAASKSTSNAGEIRKRSTLAD